MPSFDIVSKTDMTSVDNALQGVTKEMQVRYDFKGSNQRSAKMIDIITILADDELKRRQVEESMITHLTRKGVDTKALEFGKLEQAGTWCAKQFRSTRCNERWHKKLEAIKSSKLKTQAAIQGDEIRVSGKRDDLQVTMAMIKALDVDLPLQFENFHD